MFAPVIGLPDVPPSSRRISEKSIQFTYGANGLLNIHLSLWHPLRAGLYRWRNGTGMLFPPIRVDIPDAE